MSLQNLVSAQLAPADKSAILANADAIKALLPFALLLTNEERQKGLKLGTGNIGFLQKVVTYAKAHPELVPSFVDLTELEKDVQLASDLHDVLMKILPVVSILEDTYQQAGVEALMGALSIYNNIKAAVKNGVPGTQEIFDDLKTQFPGGSHTKAPVPQQQQSGEPQK